MKAFFVTSLLVLALSNCSLFLAVDLSDYNTGFKLFQHGIAFLSSDHWNTNDYSLTVDLYDSVLDAACVINNVDAVNLYSEELFAHATCTDDTLNGEFLFV